MEFRSKVQIISTYKTVNDMACVWIMMRGRSLGADKIHHLVLSFTRDTAVRENDLQVEPARILVQLLCHPESQNFAQVDHEGCSWSNTISVEFLRSVVVGTLSLEISCNIKKG